MAGSSAITEAKIPAKPSSKSKTDSHIYPKPFTVAPISQHTQTMLLLHGRGSNGEKFGLEFLAAKTAVGKSIQEHFPGMKFVFPTAKKRRAKWYNRAFTSQWFDSVPIDEQSNGMSREEVDWQLEGLAETAEFLNPVLDDEVMAVGAKNVFFGGLSQGCAMGVHLLLSYNPMERGANGNGSSLGGFIGISGWFPFADDIQDLIGPGVEGEAVGEDDDDDPSETYGEEDNGFDFEPQLSLPKQVCNFVRENLELPPFEALEPPCLQTPVFLGHGKSDEKVKTDLGLEVATVLRKIGMRVRWEEYDVGHWYKVPEEIEDIIDFIKTSV